MTRLTASLRSPVMRSILMIIVILLNLAVLAVLFHDREAVSWKAGWETGVLFGEQELLDQLNEVMAREQDLTNQNLELRRLLGARAPRRRK